MVFQLFQITYALAAIVFTITAVIIFIRHSSEFATLTKLGVYAMGIAFIANGTLVISLREEDINLAMALLFFFMAVIKTFLFTSLGTYFSTVIGVPCFCLHRDKMYPE